MREAQARCDSREFTQWQIYYEREPWGESASTWQLAVIGSMLINAQLSKGKPIKPEDLMPFRRTDREAPTQTAAEQKAIISHIVSFYQAATQRRQGRKS